jgi:hypothetical protein
VSLLTDPRYHSLRDWADYTVFDLEDYGPIPQLVSEKEWQNWGAGLIGINGISQQNPPSPYQYDDWQEWAYRFYQVLD